MMQPVTGWEDFPNNRSCHLSFPLEARSLSILTRLKLLDYLLTRPHEPGPVLREQTTADLVGKYLLASNPLRAENHVLISLTSRFYKACWHF
jgi:hypothetical protein